MTSRLAAARFGLSETDSVLASVENRIIAADENVAENPKLADTLRQIDALRTSLIIARRSPPPRRTHHEAAKADRLAGR